MSYTNGLDKPSDYFVTKLYSGNGGTQSITGLDFAPALCWFKSRTTTDAHAWYDSVRGATKRIKSNSADAETTQSTALTSFNSDGFSIGAGGDVNTSSASMAVWNWKETADAGFDIVSYTGNGSARTLSHSLSAIPKMIIVKNLTSATSWHVYHNSIGATKYLQLNSTNAEGTASSVWNDTAPTSSVFSIGSGDGTNKNTNNIIAYLFAEKQGYSKFGKFIGNGNASGTYVHLGFSPSFVLYKVSSAASDWYIQDNKRLTYNVNNTRLEANNSDAEVTGAADSIDMLSNGFKLRHTSSSFNASGATYIYMAFAENPFVTSTGIPATAR
jgi:hypothetical protein